MTVLAQPPRPTPLGAVVSAPPADGGDEASGATAHAELLSRLHPILDVLCRAVAHALRKGRPDGRLHRLDAVEAELAALYGPAWRAVCVPTAACQAYADRLREVGFTWPAGLAVHLRAFCRLDAPAGRDPEVADVLASLDALAATVPAPTRTRRTEDIGTVQGRLTAEGRRARRLGEALLAELRAPAVA